MEKRPYTPPPEAWPYLPLDYLDLSVAQRAGALRTAGIRMADDIFADLFAKAATSGSEEVRNTQ